MSLIHRYVTAQFFKFFGLILVMVIAIYLSIDVFGKIDNLIEAGRPPWEMLAYFAYKVPLIISQITPVAVLLSVLVVFGLMSKNNEVIALSSSGVSLYYLLLPVVAIGLVLSVLLFLFSETLVPATTLRSEELLQRPSRGRRAAAFKEENIWIRHERAITHIRYFHPSEEAVYGVSTFSFDENFRLLRRIDANKAVYDNGTWLLASALIQQFNETKGGISSPAAAEEADPNGSAAFHEDLRADLGLIPQDLKKVAKSAEEMRFSALGRYIEKVEREGYDATRYKVDFYAKTAFPAICLIMSIIGSAIALRGKTREGMAVSFAYGIITAFVYWSLYSLSLSLGYGGVLPPVFAAWMTNLVFFCAAGFMVLNLE
jgi:lipopolysaccharide export system permease protein